MDSRPAGFYSTADGAVFATFDSHESKKDEGEKEKTVTKAFLDFSRIAERVDHDREALAEGRPSAPRPYSKRASQFADLAHDCCSLHISSHFLAFSGRILAKKWSNQCHVLELNPLAIC